LGSRRSTN